jgi:hypothetical protein
MHFSPWLLLLGVPLLPASENGGIRMTIEFGQTGNSSQQNIYLQADRKRMEFRNSAGRTYGPRLVSITRCDLGQMFELNLEDSEYTSAPYPPKPLTKEEVEERGLQIPATYKSEKPTLRIEVSTKDTGERKELFGHIARQVITTRKQTPLGGSHSESQETVSDGWYIDLNQRLSCDPKWPEGKQGHAYLHAGRQPKEKPEFVMIGEPETGFAVRSLMTGKITYTLQNGTRRQSDWKSEVRVTELDEGFLDPALFEIPPGFKHVAHIERNPVTAASSSQMNDFWQRFKASVASLFSR